MNFLKQFFLLVFVVVAGTSCIKQEGEVFTSNVAEFDAASFNVVFGANTYPYLTRQNATYGRATVSTDLFFTRASGTATFRVNMTGAQRATPTTVKYQTFVVANALGSGTGATPAGTTAYGAPINATNVHKEAVAGVHYTSATGTCTIPANSSFGIITIPLINSGISVGETALVGLELIAGGDITVSTNYNKIVFGVSQR